MLGTFSHTGIIVDDLTVAMERYRSAFGYTWTDPMESSSPLRTHCGVLPRRSVVTLSVQTPRIELIAITDPTAYDTIPGGRRPNHVAYAVDDLAVAVATLEKSGFVRRLSGRDDVGEYFAYLADPGSEIFVELLAARVEARIAERIEAHIAARAGSDGV